MSARRAVWRWGWRLLKKDWRDQTLILALILVASALSVAGGLLAIQALPDDRLDTATLFSLDGDPAEVARVTAVFGDDAGEIRRGDAELAGALRPISVRTLDPEHPQTSALIDVLDGRLPSGPTEIAATTDMLLVLAADLGGSVELDGLPLTLVGEVENPTDLGDEFVFFDYRDGPPLQTVSQFRTTSDLQNLVPRFEGGISVSENDAPGPILRVISNVVMTLAMVLVGLIVSAGFGVVARRRVRQYGLLGAIGADDGHLRSAAAFNGFIIGAIASVIGAAIGVAVAGALLPLLEESLGHRIQFQAPPTIWLTTIFVATAMSTIAAWWPARSIARQPVVEALAARRPKARPVRNTTAVGLVMAVAGFVLLGYAASRFSIPAAIGGVLVAVAGVLLLTPATISTIGVLAGRAALPTRIAGRDLARYQGRAAAALGAIVLALAIPVAIGVISASFDAREETEPPNLADNTAIVWTPGVESNDGVMHVSDSQSTEASEAGLASIAQRYPSLTITPIEVLVSDQGFTNDNGERINWVDETYTPTDCNSGGDTWGFDGDCFRSHALWIANPELVDLWSLGIDGVSGIISSTDDPLYAIDGPNNGDNPPAVSTTSRANLPRFSSFATNLVTEDALDPIHQRTTVGWILTSPDPLTTDEIADLRSTMSQGGLVETLSNPTSETGLRTVAALIGMLVGLAILGATITLIRGESADDARVLDVLGASLTVRRRVAGATAALLAIAGAVLALPLGLLGLIIARAGESRLPIAIPWSTLAILFVLFPVVAALATAMLSGELKEAR